MKTERHGQIFGKQCWKGGLTVAETMQSAAMECGLAELPEDPAKWPKFVHGAEEAWQDANLASRDERESLFSISMKHARC